MVRLAGDQPEVAKAFELYVVCREGVYRHELGGVFTTKEAAIEGAKEMRSREDDTYHIWSVVGPFAMNALITEDVTPFSGGIWEDPFMVVFRTDQPV